MVIVEIIIRFQSSITFLCARHNMQHERLQLYISTRSVQASSAEHFFTSALLPFVMHITSSLNVHRRARKSSCNVTDKPIRFSSIYANEEERLTLRFFMPPMPFESTIYHTLTRLGIYMSFTMHVIDLTISSSGFAYLIFKSDK